MTGTGTQTDPYIVNSWEEFNEARTAIDDGRKNGAYIEFNKDATNKIIDMNDYYPEGITSPISINATSIKIGKNVKEIGHDVFKHTALREVYLPRLCIYYPDTFPKDCIIKYYD